MHTYGEMISRARAKKKLSRREVAGRAGISEAHLRFVEKGERPMSPKTLRKVATVLEIDETALIDAWLQENVRGLSLAPKELQKVPLISWVHAGDFAMAENPEDVTECEEWVWAMTKGPNVFALRVEGDSMEPEFREGEIIVVNPHIAWEAGNYVIVKNQDGEATFKQIKKKGDRWVLHPLNPKYEDIVVDNRELYVVGVVVEKLKRY